MDSLQSLALNDELRVLDGSSEYTLPEWAAALIWLGAWCRSYSVPKKRLVTFVVLPTRDLAAAFACMGSLIEGCRCFEDTLSWSRFRALPEGSVVFWKERQGKKAYAGTVIGFERSYGSDEFIRIQVTKPNTAARNGLVQNISERYFDDYLFSIEQPPSANRADTYRKAETFFKHLLGKINPKWVWADGAEALLITSLNNFELTLAGISLVTGAKLSLPFSDLLCMVRNQAHGHSKVRLSHPRGSIEGMFPLAILDGPEAFYVHEHLDNSANILVISDRSEYRMDINDAVMQLRSMSGSQGDGMYPIIPDVLPPGMEIVSYVIDAS